MCPFRIQAAFCYVMIRVVRSLLFVRGTGWGWMTKAMLVQFTVVALRPGLAGFILFPLQQLEAM